MHCGGNRDLGSRPLAPPPLHRLAARCLCVCRQRSCVVSFRRRILEIARANARRFNGTNPARKLKDFMALARCPSAHDAGHCHAQHEHLEDALMAQLYCEPYLREV